MIRLAAALAAIAFGPIGAGCASLGDHPRESRQEATAACIEAVPAESVPYADRIADCMEARGWVYTGSADPTD